MEDYKLFEYLKNQNADLKLADEIKDWLNENDENKQYFNQIKTIFDISGHSGIQTTKTKDNAWNKLYSGIHGAYSSKATYTKRRILLVAATITLLITIGLIASNFLNRIDHPSSYLALVSDNDVNEIVLADGTKVWVNKNSTLWYPDEFSDNERFVVLDGEAYFEVAKNPGKPFIIETRNSRTEVIGTSFGLSDYRWQEEAEIIVTSGLVAFESMKNKDETNPKILLEKGESGIVNKKENSIAKSEQTDLNSVAWKTQQFNFDDTPIQVVIETIEKCFDKQIVIDNPEILEYTFTGKFKNTEPDTIIQTLALTLNIEIKYKKNRIVLSN